MTVNKAEQDIIDLQTRIAFQEDAMQSMSEQLASYASDLHNAQVQIKELGRLVLELNGALGKSDSVLSDNQPPPHY